MHIIPLLVICLSFKKTIATPWNISLTAEQRRTIILNRDKILDIKQNYWNNRRYYSKLKPILELTKEQEDLVLQRFGFFFSEIAPPLPRGFVFNGTKNGESPGMETVSGVPVCPASSSYEDVQFTVNGADKVLQMVQIDSLTQWVLDEYCQSTSGSLVNSICVERKRYIDALVVNVETGMIDSEKITVVSCSANDVTNVSK